MSNRPLLTGFIKVRNEALREGDIHRVLPHMQSFCDTIVICDDASTDGTDRLIQHYLGSWLADGRAKLLTVPKSEQDFGRELHVKQQMMQLVHQYEPHWVFWMDGDEELVPEGVNQIRDFCRQKLASDDPQIAYRFHYTQLWGRTNFARTDDGFDDGMFIKLWKWRPELYFDVPHEPKTHLPQIPSHIYAQVTKYGAAGITPGVGIAPWDIIHWGNYGKNLLWKGIQYRNGRGGVDRHLRFEDAKFRATPWGKQTSEPPLWISKETRKLIDMYHDLDRRPEMFTVVIPTHNRAWALPRTLQSLLDQTYERWIALVLDDGSTDGTEQLMEEWQDKDPRIFYARYPKWGAVAMNEIGMDLACEFSEWWTRLGSDDYFLPKKLERDAQALKAHSACYGPYRVLRNGKIEEVCNPWMPPWEGRDALCYGGGFVYSWANFACRTEILRQIKAHYGNYCDPRLNAMEDFHVNSRIARFADVVWRAQVGGEFYLNTLVDMRERKNEYEHDAIWNCITEGASGNTVKTASEDLITREIIKKETDDWKDARKDS